MDHRKDKRIQERWKGKINQVINILNCSTGQPPQGEIILLVGMVGWIGHFILEMACGLSSTIPGWGKYLDQGSSAYMYEAPEAKE